MPNCHQLGSQPVYLDATPLFFFHTPSNTVTLPLFWLTCLFVHPYSFPPYWCSHCRSSKCSIYIFVALFLYYILDPFLIGYRKREPLRSRPIICLILYRLLLLTMMSSSPNPPPPPSLSPVFPLSILWNTVWLHTILLFWVHLDSGTVLYILTKVSTSVAETHIYCTSWWSKRATTANVESD